MNKSLIVILYCLIYSPLYGWLKFTNTLNDTLEVMVVLEDGSQSTFLLEPKEAGKKWYAIDPHNLHNEIPIVEIIVSSKEQVIKNWNYSEIPDPNNPTKIVMGKPIYGNKNSAELELNENFKCISKFKTKDKKLAQYNGMVTQCKRSRKQWGLDTSKRPLEIVIIQVENPAQKLSIMESVPPYYKNFAPAGMELGGSALVILAKEIKS
jgi:hypothetical protein